MSVKNALLSLLVTGPHYGAQLRSMFEDRTGGAWPLNLGQVYTTMDRFERDGLVERGGKAGHDGKLGYQLTATGHAAVETWFATPITVSAVPRDELVIKLIMAVLAPGVDVVTVIQAQRRSTMSRMQKLNAQKRTLLGEDNTLTGVLVLENQIFVADAELRWLDVVERSVLTFKADSGTAGVLTQTTQSNQKSTDRQVKS